MIEFKGNNLIITVENTNEDDFARMLETLVWVIGYMNGQGELFTDIHTLSWLAEAMLPSAKQLNARCEDS